jgi:cation transport ATPase
MDKFNELTAGAKLVLGAAIVFLIVSFFSWFDYGGPGEDELDAIGADTGITMWHGVGWIAGLIAIGLIVWQALRLANIEFEVGVTPSMITAALAVLLLIFTFIRWIDKPGGDFVDRTFWSWLGLALAIIIVVGAWMNMQASGESLAGVRSQMSAATSRAREAVDRDDAPAQAPAAPSAPSAADTGDTVVDDAGEEPPKPA